MYYTYEGNLQAHIVEAHGKRFSHANEDSRLASGELLLAMYVTRNRQWTFFSFLENLSQLPELQRSPEQGSNPYVLWVVPPAVQLRIDVPLNGANLAIWQ
ncbi:MAG: hypothetical protein JWM56_483 [Candidatus Peribacteria bacterium]|nr:hypothetical protein [Candidatus Peribacteria bacterium]